MEAHVMQKTNRKGVLRMEELGHEAAVGSFDGKIRVYNIPDLKKLHEFEITPDPIMGLAFISRYEAVTIDYKGYLRKIDMSSGEIIQEKHIGKEDYYSLEVSHDKQFVGVSRSYFMEVFETEGLENVAEQRLPSKGNYGIGFSPDGKYIGMGSADKTVRVWPMNILVSV
jgi:WD40 repeat protein